MLISRCIVSATFSSITGICGKILLVTNYTISEVPSQIQDLTAGVLTVLTVYNASLGLLIVLTVREL